MVIESIFCSHYLLPSQKPFEDDWITSRNSAGLDLIIISNWAGTTNYLTSKKVIHSPFYFITINTTLYWQLNITSCVGEFVS